MNVNTLLHPVRAWKDRRRPVVVNYGDVVHVPAGTILTFVSSGGDKFVVKLQDDYRSRMRSIEVIKADKRYDCSAKAMCVTPSGVWPQNILDIQRLSIESVGPGNQVYLIAPRGDSFQMFTVYSVSVEMILT